MMGIAANVALVLSGSFVKHVNATLARGSTQAMLGWLVGAVVAMAGAMSVAKWALDRWEAFTLRLKGLQRRVSSVC